MARPRKKAADLTTEEAIRKLFPTRIRNRAKKEAEEAGKKSRNPSTHQE